MIVQKRIIHVVFITTTTFIAVKAIENNNLTCFATLAPENKIICPEGRNKFCMKEFVNSTRRECGTTSEYPNDDWDIKQPGGLCVYRKCSSSCPNETVNFVGRDGSVNSRKSVCCTTNLCNSASSHRMHAAIVGLVPIIVALILMK